MLYIYNEEGHLVIQQTKDNMTQSKLTTPVTTYFFILLLFAGALFIAGSFFMGMEELINWMSQVGTGLLLIGLGEWINHPLQKSLTYEEKGEYTFRRFKHRRRKPSGIGNLLEIGGLLLVFMGVAEII